MTSHRSANSRLGMGCAILFALPFAAVGVFASYQLLSGAVDALRMLTWEPVPCFIDEAKLEVHHDSDGNTYRVTAKYHYQLQQIEFRNERVSIFLTANNVENHHAFHRRLETCQQTGKPWPGFVNSANPREAILDRDLPWKTTLFWTMFAVIFSGVGFGILGGVLLVGTGTDGRHEPTSADSPPWECRTDWASGMVRYSDRPFGQLGTWLGLVSVVLAAPSAWAACLEVFQKGNHWAWLGFLPAAAAAMVLSWGLKKQSRWRQFGESTFQMATIPGVLGGRLEGSIRIARFVDSPEGFAVRLEAISKTTSGDDTVTKTEWEHEVTVQAAENSSEFDGTAIPVQIQVPYRIGPTQKRETGRQLDWVLSVKSLPSEIGYRAKFEVPIFRTALSQIEDEPECSKSEAIAADPETRARLFAEAGIQCEQLTPGEFRLVFPPCRNFAFVTGMIFASGVLSAFVLVPGWIFLGTFWFQALLVVIGFLILTSSFDWTRFRSEVTLAEDHLATRSGSMYLGQPVVLNIQEIDSFEMKMVGSVGTIEAFHLYAKRKSGSQLLLAKRIAPRATANEVTRLFDSWLKNALRNANIRSEAVG